MPLFNVFFNVAIFWKYSSCLTVNFETGLNSCHKLRCGNGNSYIVIHDIMKSVVLFNILIHSELSFCYCNSMYAFIPCINLFKYLWKWREAIQKFFLIDYSTTNRSLIMTESSFTTHPLKWRYQLSKIKNFISKLWRGVFVLIHITGQ